jgi:hypothetical protein
MYKVEEKLHLRVREQGKLSATGLTDAGIATTEPANCSLKVLLGIHVIGCSSVGTGCDIGGRETGVRFPAGGRRFPLHRPAVGTNRGLFPRRFNDPGVKMIARQHFTQRPRMCGVVLPLPHTSSWPGALAELYGV